MEHQNWVQNEIADNIIVKMQSGKFDLKTRQKFLDLISGVKGYSIANPHNQGIISKILANNKTNTNSINSLISIDDVVSVFWCGVFKYLPRAKQTGSSVKALANGSNIIFEIRKTRCNPIYYLRKMGVLSVKNYINKVYKKNLIQSCDDCGKSFAIHKSTSKGTCDKVYSCPYCYSLNIKTDRILMLSNEPITEATTTSIEEDFILAEETYAINELINQIYDSFPSNPSDGSKKTKSRDIFSILVGIETDGMLCENICLSCKKSGNSCGIDRFDINKCVNYTKKISEYQKCSASLTSRRIKGIKSHVINFIRNHSDDTYACKSLNKLLCNITLI